MREFFIIVYFGLLIYLALYGVHLYYLVYLYHKHRHHLPVARPVRGETPMVTVQLPIYNERAVCERLIRAVANFDWPKNRLEIQVLDDSIDETSEVVAKVVSELTSAGVLVEHIRRLDRVGYKAGALAEGLKRARGEFVAIFDADNLPLADFLTRMIGQFDDESVGAVQARWSFLNRDESLLCRAQALFLDAHFFVEQAARSRGGLFMNFNGTAGIWRLAAIEQAGGWQADTLTEDLDISYRAQLAGWRMVFMEEVEVPTELPSSIRAFKAQQFRWAKGAIQTARKLLPNIFSSDIPVRVKLSSMFHLTQKTVGVALLLLSFMLIPALYYRMEGGYWKLLLIDMPIFIAGTGSMSLFYGLAYKRDQNQRSLISNLLLPMISSMGIGLSVNNSLAVFSAFGTKHREFVRTPKSGTIGKQKLKAPSDYKVSFDLSGRLETILAVYAIGAVGTALVIGLYVAVPFLLTFLSGFVYFSYSSIRELYA